MTTSTLPKGIVSLLETPFLDDGTIDCESLLALIEATIAAGINGLTGPLVASEVHALSLEEREEVIERSAVAIKGRVPYIVGASSDDIAIARHFARLAEQVGAAAYVVAVPNALYGHTDELLAFLRTITEASAAPLVLQDLQWNGPGLDLDTLRRLRDELPTLAGFKIETVPAGTKYTLVREAFGPGCYIAGGWAVTQLVEALDRGVDAMIPEAVAGAHLRRHHRRPLPRTARRGGQPVPQTGAGADLQQPGALPFHRVLQAAAAPQGDSEEPLYAGAGLHLGPLQLKNRR